MKKFVFARQITQFTRDVAFTVFVVHKFVFIPVEVTIDGVSLRLLNGGHRRLNDVQTVVNKSKRTTEICDIRG